MRPCPACGRKIQDAAQKCHYCGAPAPHAPRPGRTAAPVARPAEQPAKKSLTLAILIAAVVAAVVGLLLLWSQA